MRTAHPGFFMRMEADDAETEPHAIRADAGMQVAVEHTSAEIPRSGGELLCSRAAFFCFPGEVFFSPGAQKALVRMASRTLCSPGRAIFSRSMSNCSRRTSPSRSTILAPAALVGSRSMYFSRSNCFSRSTLSLPVHLVLLEVPMFPELISCIGE